MLRFFAVVGLVGGLLIAYLTTLAVGPVGQLPPSESLLTNFRAEGYVPANLNLEEDERAEEAGVFEVPEEDEVQLAAAEAAFDKMMGGMDMSGSDGGMDMSGADSGMDMAGSDSGMDMSGADSGMDMASADMPMGEAGLAFAEDGAFDREITLEMTEWKFSQMSIDVKPGERIKFTVKNSGEIPHEFMFMSPPLMNAVTYRATRADWSLYEHEALYERALVLPGGDFSFVMQVQQPGSWMFMCMLPYHMQMGMMGQMATEGMAMEM